MIPRIPAMIAFLKRQQADVIAIQEINENEKRGYQFTRFLQELQYDGHLASHVRIGNGAYGIASFSRLPIISTSHVLLPSQKEQRGFLDTTIQWNNKMVHIINTHLGLSKKERENQLDQIISYTQPLHSPFLVTGDFNQSQLSLEEAGFLDSAKEMNVTPTSTMMFSNQRIDYIFHSKELKVMDYQIKKVTMSDHYPQVATFALH